MANPLLSLQSQSNTLSSNPNTQSKFNKNRTSKSSNQVNILSLFSVGEESASNIVQHWGVKGTSFDHSNSLLYSTVSFHHHHFPIIIIKSSQSTESRAFFLLVDCFPHFTIISNQPPTLTTQPNFSYRLLRQQLIIIIICC